MKTKLIISLCLLTAVANAQPADSLELTRRIDSLAQITNQLHIENSALQGEVKKLQSKVNTLALDLKNARESINEQADYAVTLNKGITQNADNLQIAADSLSRKLEATDENLSLQSESLDKATLWGIITGLVILIVSLVISIVLHKRGNNRIEELKAQAEKLNEKIVSQFTTEVSELQKISASLSGLASAGSSTDGDHDLIKTLADRITFMEMTLYKMDKSIRGHKHLTKTLSQMKDNLLASGYEIVDMLGKSYHPGMKVTANFIDDESLEEGAQIITSIIKPQINYRGQAIQTAQITVSQNI